MENNLKWAIAYVKRGWSIIPIVPGEKRPLISSWLEYQKRQPSIEELEAWFQKWPDSSLAIIVGKISGLVVIDIDDPIEGEKSFRQLFGNIVPGIVKTTHGTHYYFKHPGNRVISNAIRAAPGLDVKADGGYVLAPPSPGYKWLEKNIIALPENVLDNLGETKPKIIVDFSDSKPVP